MWAGAVDGLCLASVMLERTEIVALVPLALASLHEAGAPTGLGLRAIGHLPDVLLGRTENLVALCAEAVERGDDLETKWCASTVALAAVSAGDLPTARHHLAILDAVLRRWGLTKSPNTAGFGFFAALDLAMLEGRLDDARMLASAALTTSCRTDHAFPAAWGSSSSVR